MSVQDLEQDRDAKRKRVQMMSMEEEEVTPKEGEDVQAVSASEHVPIIWIVSRCIVC